MIERDEKKLKRTDKDAKKREAFERYHNGGARIEDLATELNISTRTFYRWLRQEKAPQTPDQPKSKRPRARPRLYPDVVFSRIEALKRENPRRPATRIHFFLKVEYGDRCPSIYTVRKYLAAKGLNVKDPRARQGYVKFCRDKPNDLWQIDIAGVQTVGHLGKLYLIAILDDRSRFIVAASYFRDQRGTNVLRVLRDAFEEHGRPNQVVADNGLQFKNAVGDLGTKYSRLLQSLDVQPIFARPHHPQTKGKLERWFGTVKTNFLSEERPLVARKLQLTLVDFNRRFHEWLHWYNLEKPHRSLRQYKYPARCYIDHPERIHRPLETTVDWDYWLVTTATRKVTKYNAISYKRETIPVPPGHAGCRVEVYEGDDKLEVYYRETCVASHALNRDFQRLKNKQFQRKVSKAGYIKYQGQTYRVDPVLAGEIAMIQEMSNGTRLAVYIDGVLYGAFKKKRMGTPTPVVS